MTFLFTDVEGSTRLWDLHPAEMRGALARHDEIVRDVVGRHAGYVFSTGGDSFAVAFGRAGDALGAAVAVQGLLREESWPEAVTPRVRMALHTGEAFERDGDYFGSAVNRAARLMGLAAGGEIVCSEATAQVLRGQLPAGLALVPVGLRRLKGLIDSERVFAVVGEGLTAPTAAGRSVEGNLPRLLSRLIGRGQEAAEIATLVGGSRLVTLTGPGGVGKTSLALYVAGSLADKFPDGVWWLDLAPIGDTRDVVRAAAAALEVRDQGGQALLETICDALEQRRMLFVVDNCEHVASAMNEMVTALGQRCGTVTVLATSRERLGVSGERVFAVHPLAAASVDDPAMDLLLERIDRRDLLDDAVEVAALLQICQSLDGLPLALELAAARCVALQPSDVASRLGSHLRVLADRRRSEARHQTVQATIEWSYDLLDEPVRMVFERLGVCASWDLETAEVIGADSNLDPWDVDEAVAALVDKSLVEHQGRRYRMLETTRAFALERLADRGDLERRQDAHMLYFTEVARRARVGLRGPDEARWVDLLDADWPNIRSAFRRAMDTGDADTATTIVAHLNMEGQFRRQEALSWSRDALARFGDYPHPLGHLLLAATSVAELMRGDVQRCLELGLRAMQTDPTPGRSLDLLPEAAAATGLVFSGRWPEAKIIRSTLLDAVSDGSNQWLEMMFRSNLAFGENNFGDPEAAKVAARAARAATAEIGAPTATAWTSYVCARVRCGTDDESRHWLDAALDGSRAVRNAWIESMILIERSSLLARQDPAHARDVLDQVARDFRRGGWILHSWSGLVTAAEVLIELDEPENAARLLGAVRASPWQHMLARRLDALATAVGASLDSSRLDQLVAEGATLDFNGAADIAGSQK